MTKTCSIVGCNSPVLAKGYCTKHYGRLIRLGDPLASSYDAIFRFIDKAVTHECDECLIWPLGKNRNGYGRVTVDGKRWLAHRYICFLKHGEPPSPLSQAAHTCGMGHIGCVSGSHLRWATPKENASDALLHGARVHGTRHPNARLTENEVRTIRQLQGKKTGASVAKSFGVHPNHVYEIWNRRRWAHLK